MSLLPLDIYGQLLESIKQQTDKLTFDDLSSLMINRVDSMPSLRKSLQIPERSLFQVPEGFTVIVLDDLYAIGDLYVEGDILVI